MSAVVQGTVNLPSMTEEEFERWCDEDTRAEYVDGKVILRSPVSTTQYRVNKFLLELVDLYVAQKQVGELLGPEFMVRLRTGLRRVPDLLYVASDHLDRIQETVLEGTPDAVWEIISPDSELRDWQEKVPEYRDAGIAEYWIVNPYVKTVWLLRLNADGQYEHIEPEDGRLHSAAIPGFWLKPEWLFTSPLPSVLNCLRELGALPEA